ncbi:MAG: RdgB/HAM1 family non-canonical purine NTP pyrophosphatase [Elusimicrobiaceae bacterium]|nr:RdgB/HAM1 family non-canonical purine NTP pyrophosphatase [Elusimicrobiaceae bacterium]
MEILLATSNPHKVKELLKILPVKTKTGKVLIYKTLADFPNFPPIIEDGKTLEENAQIKAVFGLAHTGLITLADDTGLMVDFLQGAPGVNSARYAYADRCDNKANNEKLLKELSGVPTAKRTARFKTFAALALPTGQLFSEEGKIEGRILTDYKGSGGFGYDALFYVPDYKKTLAEMTAEEKNTVSHRGETFRNISKYLIEL